MHFASLLVTLVLLCTSVLASLESWEESYLAYAHAQRSPRMVKVALAEPKRVRNKRDFRPAAGWISEDLDADELPTLVAGSHIDRKRAAEAKRSLAISTNPVDSPAVGEVDPFAPSAPAAPAKAKRAAPPPVKAKRADRKKKRSGRLVSNARFKQHAGAAKKECGAREA